MQHINKKVLFLSEAAWLAFTIAGLVLIFRYIFTELNFFYGVDYRMFLAWHEKYISTGSFYSENTVFYNFPLTVIAFGPWHLFGERTAVFLKALQTAGLGIFSVFLLFRITGKALMENMAVFFCFLLLFLTFFAVQIAYLNIYAEVLCALMLSLFFYKKEKEWLSAFFLALGILFKIFLAPLILAPLLAGSYRLFFRTCFFLAGLILLSFMIFGIQTHIDMVSAITKTYTKMRLFGLYFPYVADGFSGYQDLLNKLSAAGLMTQDMVQPFTMILALFYGSVVCYILYLIFRISGLNQDGKNFYYPVFATLLIFSLGFNFRFDHGLLLLTTLPFFALISPGRMKTAVAAVILIVLIRYPVEQLLTYAGLGTVATLSGKVTAYLTFHFIGINLFFWYFATYWTDLYRKAAYE